MKIIPGIKIIANTIQIIGSINIPNKNIPKYIKIFKIIGIYYYKRKSEEWIAKIDWLKKFASDHIKIAIFTGISRY